MCHILSHLNPRQQEDLPSNTMANPKNEAEVWWCMKSPGWRAKSTVGDSRRARSLNSLSALGDSPNVFYCPLSASLIPESTVTFGGPKVAGRDKQPREKAKNIKINEEAVASMGKATKLRTTGGKEEGKETAPASPEASSDSGSIYASHLITSESEASSNSECIYASHLISSESEGERQEDQAAFSELEDDEVVAVQRAEL
uniref:Uncharacterized protein n=1 Tax=Solanum tuberosum TaxID=4113 RepID=M1DK18_SOLTU